LLELDADGQQLKISTKTSSKYTKITTISQEHDPFRHILAIVLQ